MNIRRIKSEFRMLHNEPPNFARVRKNRASSSEQERTTLGAKPLGQRTAGRYEDRIWIKMVRRRVQLRGLWWYCASDVEPSGYSASDVQPSGYSASNVQPSGYSASDLQPSRYITSEVEPSSFITSDVEPSAYS
jgi:hypothetical protein